ncbi:MAG TPA: YciI family protein [Candidatus Kapabacteria bacterium]|nr:YciI family protein [Candidatus Kapabacteria bacterium]
MNEFVFLYRGGMSNNNQPPSPQEMEASMKRWQTWFGKLGEEGKLKDWGAPLQREGKHVASGGVITDGPFSEGKEVIGGYSIIKARDLTEAAVIAKGCPVFEAGGSVEVRPVAPM